MVGVTCFLHLYM